MSYDTWKCAPPDEELEMEACGHAIGTCVCDQAPVEEYSSEDAEIDGWKCARCPDGNAWADRGVVTVEVDGDGLGWNERSHGYSGCSGSGRVPMSVLRWLMRLEGK